MSQAFPDTPVAPGEPLPRVLLAEDDPASAAMLRSSSRGMEPPVNG